MPAKSISINTEYHNNICPDRQDFEPACAATRQNDTCCAGGDASSLYYLLDGRDRIADAGGAWDRFAMENDGNDILRERVIGSSIYDHVVGDTSGMFLRTLLSSVRLLGRPLTRPYRCDSPDTKRFMEMTLVAEEDDSVRLSHRLVRSEPFGQRFIFTVERGRQAFLVRCSMCNRVKRSNHWMEPEVAAQTGEFQAGQPQSVIYGVCPRCLEGIRGNG